MSTNENVVGDLKDLLRIANDGKEGYKSAEEATKSAELKGVFSRFMGERIVYAEELKEHIAMHGAEADNEDGGILGSLHRTWLTIKQALSSNEDAAILGAIVTGDRAAIEKYDEYIEDYERHADHLALLTAHRDGIKSALAEIEILQVKFNQPDDSAREQPMTDNSATGAAAGYAFVSEAEQSGSEGIVSPMGSSAGTDVPDPDEFEEETDELEPELAGDEFGNANETGLDDDDETGLEEDEEPSYIDDDEPQRDENFIVKGDGSVVFPDDKDTNDSFPQRGA
ncbi:ferritin-like domain-containing protein [Hufsiella ginkgonis]|uniref:ferritin-like domain-containing protein n=1 Tax=Hufsiella ginkgonis TaxID=2695274 RepID=UPI0019258B24|nr:PA2169 family four-helix-bundle protein [Hufsiella ginkgonis]